MQKYFKFFCKSMETIANLTKENWLSLTFNVGEYIELFKFLNKKIQKNKISTSDFVHNTNK